MPIQPKPSADTSRPDLPNVRFCISSSLVNRTITLTAPSGHRVQRGLHFFTAPHIAPDREGAAALLLYQACRLLIALSDTSATTTLAPPVTNATLPSKRFPVVSISRSSRFHNHVRHG